MKTTPVLLFFLLTICSAAFSQHPPLLGARELISGAYNLPDNPTERSQPDRLYPTPLTPRWKLSINR